MGSLSPEQLGQFEDQGFLLVKGLLNPERDLDPVIREYETVLDGVVNRMFAKGEISSRYEDLPFGQRVIRVQLESGKNLVQNFDFSLPKGGVQADTPIWVGEAIFNILTNAHLLDAVESLIGPEIYANPVQHVRMKVPEKFIPPALMNTSQIVQTPWHQDNGVVLPEADGTEMITVWFPLKDAPVSAGPLRILPYSHRSGLFQHCPVRKASVSIPQELIDDIPVLSLPMKRGDVLFMHRLMAHSALPNQSNDIRWSFDLRFNPVDQPTGRDVFPGFIARSRRAPETELHDPVIWADRWLKTRDRLAVEGMPKAFSRWDPNAALCA